MKTHNTKFDITLLTVRVIIGFVIAAHGAQKLLGWFGGYGFDGTMGFFTGVVGLPYILALGIILVESVGMIALALGLFSRLMASGIIAIMLGAVVTSHYQFGFFMNWFGAQGGEGFEYHLLAITLAGVIALHGAGAYSLDAVVKKNLAKSGKLQSTLFA